MKPSNEIDQKLGSKLALLKTTPVRNPEREAAGMAAFLEDAKITANAVTTVTNRRHIRWMHALQSLFIVHLKEVSPMASTIATILLIFSLLVGGGGATVAAAQTSQPEQPLYSVKVLSEDVRLGLVAGPQSKFMLALLYADRRAAEIQTMLQNGSIPPEAVLARYQNLIAQTFQFALALPDEQAAQAFEQIQSRLLIQQQAFLQVPANRSPQVDAVLLQTRQILQVQLRTAELGITEPDHLRNQLRQRDQIQATTATPRDQTTQVSPGTGAGNPWTTGTPTPGSGYGPGSGTGNCETCTPSHEGEGQNSWTTGTPTPNSGYGSGSGPEGPGPGLDPSRTCTPGSGPLATQQQNNQPTEAGPKATQQQVNQPTQEDPQPTTAPGGPGGKH
jgi:hypothetical protein